MSKPLIIVESPTKAKTISRFLGGEYQVEASMGHVRDLPKSKMSIDTENGFVPTYIIPVKAKETVAKLKKMAKTAPKVILATDEDREGEAISWHLVEALGLEKKTKERIVFHEITKTAIAAALQHPRDIDQRLVDAQQARRVLDRLVGYELSPFLWRKIRYGLSAGRVQSVAVRLVVEREREIQSFKQDEYWSIEADLSKNGDKKIFTAKLSQKDGKAIGKLEIQNEQAAKALLDELAGASYQVSAVSKKDTTRNPSPPFTTSTLQQEAARKFGMSAKQTMLVAQQLYEGVDLGEEGSQGLITYMRTDSLNLAASALSSIKEVVTKVFGSQYALEKPKFYTNKSKGAQEAHEAIRPTEVSRTPESLKIFLDKNQYKIYDIIWKRTIACQMASALLEQTAADIAAKNFIFRATGQTIKFDGFIRAYTEGRDEENQEDEESTLPELLAKEPLELHKLSPTQHFTEPPPRYSDATLIKALESHGVGRPSTYAPTLSTIQDREYVEKLEKKYHPTEIGFLVNDMLVENFPEIVDINFTSHIEEELDEIAEGTIPWAEVCKEFYLPFKKHLTEKEESVKKQIETTDIPCPTCGKMMVIKFGRMGKFLACSDIECKTTQPLPEEAAKIKELTEKTRGEKCPICHKEMEVKRGRFGYFLGCVDYPTCKGISKIWNKTGFKCPACGLGDVVERKSRGRGKTFYACNRFPDCNFIMNKKPENEAELQEALKTWKENPPKPKKPYKKKTP